MLEATHQVRVFCDQIGRLEGKSLRLFAATESPRTLEIVTFAGRDPSATLPDGTPIEDVAREYVEFAARPECARTPGLRRPADFDHQELREIDG